MHMYEGMLLYFYMDDLLKYDRDEIMVIISLNNV